MVFVDDYSRRVSVIPLKRRRDAGTGLRRYIAEVGHIEELRCDGAIELAEGNLLHAAAQFGIAKSFSVPHVHQQNGVAERMIQTLNNTATSMLVTANLPRGFWPWAVQAAAYVRNRCPCRTNKGNTTPYEMWKNFKPDLRKLRVFGCLAYPFVRKHERATKFSPKCDAAIFVGYHPQMKDGYLFWIPRVSIHTSYRFERGKEMATHMGRTLTKRQTLKKRKTQTSSPSMKTPLTHRHCHN
ncbi:unnamed protein product [Vitrella brassicaformis CCMP3155]|uniref:Integrase catalytic domain-containing protein n=1 Tax=Vitrella brassicaformis (strain CCMP3155) TaxID=1169540 RepID=A0A0G4GRN3_VITBC|nr:unnamed protein product [Vitrella brassicaformis CCMP3155]|eukprot:CEM33199.1 unnamed protein product [Vitrella brassicaformis CCMP3155]